ncbi:MAG: SPASM domain-containing protein, partial [Deltaproteobacteria bacterium]|nr:SPASM domain-containing protein [Deltaproteobacteria bacterium]
YDFNHEDVLGDLTEESLYDIWNGPRMTSYREAMCRGDFHQVPICCDCPRWKAPYKKMEMLDGLLVSTQWEGKTIQMVKRAFEPAALRGVCSDLPRTTRILQ